MRARTAVVGTLLLTLSVGLAAADRYRAASSGLDAGSEVFAELALSTERTLREIESSERRLTEDPVLLPAALTTVPGLREDGERLDEDFRTLNIWTEDLARLDRQIETELAAARADERGKTAVRSQWMSLKGQWDERLRSVRSAHLEWIDAVADVHAFMTKQLSHTRVDGETVVFETDEAVGEFNKLMRTVSVAAEGVFSSTAQYKAEIKEILKEARGASSRERFSILTLLEARGASRKEAR